MKRTINLSLVLLLICFSNAKAIGKDSTALRDAIGERLSPLLSIGRSAFGNPSLQPFSWQSGLTVIRAGGSFRNEDEARVMQEGDGRKAGMFEARSWLRLDSLSTVWGHAGYSFGKTAHVYLNAVSDFRLLFPYVMADTVGGDTKMETYTFGGGYAREFGRLAIGLSAHYRANLEYRTVDPRPRNVVADLDLSGGVSCSLPSGHVLGAAVYGNVYRQRSTVKFMHPKGETRIFQLLGMGMYSTRFSNETAVQYDGGGVGAGLDLVPRDGRGFLASLGYRHFTVERILLNTMNLPLTRVKEDRLEGMLAWRTTGPRLDKAVELTVSCTDRKGIESIYGDSGSDNYPKINDITQYGHRREEARLRGIIGWGRSGRFAFAAEPHAFFRHFKSSYASPRLSMEVAEAGGGALFSCTASFKGSVLQVKAGGDYSTPVKDELDIALLSSGTFFNACLERQFETLRQGYVSQELALCWNLPLKYRLMLAFDGKWNHIYHENHNRSDLLEFGCSLSF